MIAAVIMLAISLGNIDFHQIGITPEVWSLALGLIVPPLISYVKSPTTSRTVATIMVAIASLLLGVVGAVIAGKLDLSGTWDVGRILTSAGATFTEATLFYNSWFAGTQTNAKLIYGSAAVASGQASNVKPPAFPTVTLKSSDPATLIASLATGRPTLAAKPGVTEAPHGAAKGGSA